MKLIKQMKAEELIKNYTHFIKDENGNEWKVIEVSDLPDIVASELKEARDERNKAVDLLTEWNVIGYGFDPDLRIETRTFLSQLKDIEGNSQQSNKEEQK